MQDVVEHLIRMFPVYLIGAFDAQVQGRGCVCRKGDGYSMVVANFTGFRVARVGARVSLADERCQVVWNRVQIQ